MKSSMKSWIKRAVSSALVLAMVLGMAAALPPAYAAQTNGTNGTNEINEINEIRAVNDGFGFDTSPPSDFDADDGENPYGQGRVALNPIREILVMGAGMTPAVYDANDPKDYKATVTSLPDVIGSQSSDQNARYKLLAFDPNGSGKDDHVACIGILPLNGYGYYNSVKLWVVNAKTGQQVGRTITLTSENVQENYYNTQEEAYDLLSIAAGDMDGDGRDELYAFVPGRNDSSKTNGKIVKIDAPWNSAADFIPLDSRAAGGAAVPLAMGDADGDGKDELAYALTTSGYTNYVSIFLQGDRGLEWTAETDKGFNPSYNRNSLDTSLAFGNLNNDNKEDLVMAYRGDRGAYVYSYQFRQNRGESLSAEKKGVYADVSMTSAPVLVCFARDGMKSPDNIFLSGLVLYPDLTLRDYQRDNYLNHYNIYSAVAGNFDGNTEGRENVLYSYSYTGTSYTTQFKTNLAYEDDVYSLLMKAWFPGTFDIFLHGGSYIALAAPDVDEDTVFLEYRSKEYTFDNPKLISILQAAPYFEDLADYYYDATGGTSFGTSSSSGGGSSQSTSVSAHATLKIGAEFGFIVTVAAYVETTASTQWSSEYAVMETTTLETKFNGGKQENNVVLLGIPVTLYTYDVYAPNGRGGYDKDQMVISVPGDPQYSVITVEQYNAAARAGGLPLISESQVHATPGDPASYYQEGSGELRGLTNLVTYKGDYISVGGSGTATTTRSITKDTERSITDTFTYDIDISAGMEAAGSGFSLGGGFGESNSSVQVETRGVNREVEVANVPAEGQGLYGFQWNMAIWDTRVGGQTVPVVGYVTRNVKQPPALPGAFTVTETTSHSVTLGWEESSAASSYELYQYFKESSTNQYVRVAALDGGETEYTVSGLGSGRTYEYVICSLNAGGERSVYSAPVTAVTLPEGGQSPSILAQPEDARVRPGADAVFRVSAQPAAGTAGLTYTWYESAKGGSVWNRVGGSSSTLALPQATTRMDGSRYRCVVSQVIGGQQVLVYSDVATLHVGQGETSTALTMTQNSGKAGYSEETTTHESVTVPKTRQITVDENTASYVEYVAAGNPTTVYRANDGTYYVLEGLDEAAGTAAKAVPLSRKPSEFQAENGVTIPEGVTPDSLTGTEQGVFTIPSGSAASGTQAGDYYVYTAEITETGTEGSTTVTRTVYAPKSKTAPTTYYTLSQEIAGEGDSTKITYTMTEVTQTIGNVQPVMEAGTLIVKETTNDGTSYTGEVVASIPENDSENTYTTYEVYNGNASGDKVYGADGAYYLLTFDTTETNKVTARNALTVVTYDTLEGEGYTDITPGEAVTETVIRDIIVLEPKSGDPVTLTAGVEESAGTANPAGTVTFRITNTDTGVSKNQTVTLSGGKAALTWTPDAPGVYSITASYNGNSSFLTSTSSPGTYYAIADGGNEFAGLVLRPDTTDVEYGDIVNLKLYEAKAENGVVTERESGAANVRYTLRWENPAFDPKKPESGGNQKYLEEIVSPAWTADKAPGSYVFTAKADDGRSASAAVTVTRRNLELAVEDREVSMGTVPAAGDLSFRRAGDKAGSAWAAGEDYTGLFTVSTPLTASSGSGVYQVTPVMVGSPDGARLAAFNSRYAWTPVSGQWTVQANTHTVTLTAGVNGTVTGYVGDSFTALTGTVKHGEWLRFTAEPRNGFHVSGWTLNGQAVGPGTAGVTLSADLTRLTVASLTQDLAVHVTFSNQSCAVAFGADSGGGGIVTAKNGGKQIPPGGRVVGGTSVTFTAEPDQGKIVKSWTVNGRIQKNEDGSNFAGNELTLDNISEDISVVVAFEEAVSCTVTFSAVNTKGEPAQSGAVTLDSQGLDGNNRAVKGSRVVLKAAPGPGSAILEWQESTDGGKTWATLAGSQGSFTISNLQGDRNIRVRINESVTTHRLTFQVVDLDTGAPLAEAGALTASIGGETVTTGGDFLTSSRVDFTFQPAPGYEAAEWQVNDAGVQQGFDKLTYTIDSLLGNTTVRVAVHKKPRVTVRNAEAAQGGVTVEGLVNGRKTEIADGGYADYGTDLTVTLRPAVGYEVAGGETMGAVANSDDRWYTISHVTGDQTIEPAWAEIPRVPLTFSVVDKSPEAQGGTDGTIAAVVSRKGLPGYAQSVETEGAEAKTIYAYRDSVVTFVSKPDAGYTIGTRKLDGNIQREQIRLNITAEHPRHVVEIQFDPVGQAITYGFDRDETTELAAIRASFAASGANPSDFNSGNLAGSDGTLTFTVSDLNPEYQIEGWYVNGVKQEETGPVYTMAVTRNVGAIVRVRLVPVQYAVTFASDQGSVTAKAVEFESEAGEITIGSGRRLNSGSRVAFTAPAVNGYRFTGWTVNGQDVGTANPLTIDPLRQDTAVEANYEMIVVNYQVAYGVRDGSGTLTAAAGGQSLGTSPAQAGSGSRVVFTASPGSGYQVRGWYSDEGCTQPIAGTQAEQKIYSVSGLTGDISVYVSFEPVPAYEITVDITGTKQGAVTAAVNGQAADLSGGRLTVSRHDNVTLAATPNENQRLVAWTLDGADRGNGSMVLNLTDVTAGHAVAAEFGSTQSVFLTVKAEGGGGSVAARLGYGDALQTVDATNGCRADVGQTVQVTARPDPGYMVKSWAIDGEAQDNLGNTLTVDSLTKTTVITVEYEPLALYSIPASDSTKGYTVTDVAKTPADYGDAGQIRGRGTVAFTVKPAQGQYLTELKIGGVDCLPGGESGDGISTPSGAVTVQNNQDGSYTVTVKNVRQDIGLAAASMRFQTLREELTAVPPELAGVFQSVDDLQQELRAQIKAEDSGAADDQTALLDIRLQYTDDGGSTWKEATAEHFPKGGIRVSLSYEELGGGMDQSYDFTVIHMFTTGMNGHTAGETETITPDQDASGLHFTVSSLSPFAVGWTKPAEPVDPEPGDLYPIAIEETGHGKVTASPASAGSGSTVTLTAAPDSGYELDTLTAADSQGKEIELTAQGGGKYTFQMPGSKVTVKAVFTAVRQPSGGGGGGGAIAVYPIAIEEAGHGKVTASPASAGSGSTVTLTAAPDSGYGLDTLTAVDSQGNEIKLTAQGGGKYTFRMPGRAVTVKAVFAPVPGDGAKPCDGGADCPSHGFADLGGAEAWYHDAVDYVLRHGLMGGYDSGRFGPDDSLTRAQLAQILYNRAGRPAAAGGSRFADVASGQWYTEAILWASQNGIVSGYGDGTFGPEDNITREQLAVMLWRWAKSPAAAGEEPDFRDADQISGYARDAVRWAAEQGILHGLGDGRLDPKGPATRAQAAQMLKNLMENQQGSL